MVSSLVCRRRTAARLSLAAGRAAGRSSASARRGNGIAGFPKSNRILRSKDFRRVYDNGAKFSGPLFSAFCLRNNGVEGVRIGFTCPRALGGAVVRNRIRRRVREAVRTRLEQAGAGWEIVINPRLRVMTVPFPQLEREIEKLLQRCAN
jgi:ribonuclease P protein component